MVWPCLEWLIGFNINKWPISGLLDKNNVDITYFIHNYFYFSQKLYGWVVTDHTRPVYVLMYAYNTGIYVPNPENTP